MVIFNLKKNIFSCQFAQQKGTLTMEKSGLHPDYGKVTEKLSKRFPIENIKNLPQLQILFLYTNG